MSAKLLSADEVAPLIGRSSRTVINYCKAGIFPNAHKDGPMQSSKWVIPQTDLDEYLARRQTFGRQ